MWYLSSLIKQAGEAEWCAKIFCEQVFCFIEPRLLMLDSNEKGGGRLPKTNAHDHETAENPDYNKIRECLELNIF